jgi:hypothetical protein
MSGGALDDTDWQTYALWPYFFAKEAVAALQTPGWAGKELELKAILALPFAVGVGAFYWFDANGVMFWRDQNLSNLAFAYGTGAAAALVAVKLRKELIIRALTGKW